MLKIYDLSVNYNTAPSLIPTKDLCFGWKLDSDENDVMQSSYRIVISKNSEVVSDTGTVYSDKFINVKIKDLVLDSKTEYNIGLTVTDNKNNTASTSITAGTEILPDEWEATWIKPEEHIEGWAPYLRTKFTVEGIKKAIMYVCGLGSAEYYINGKKTDDVLLDIPATNYEKEILYRRIDVTDMLNDGGNAITILLEDGFYSQSKVWEINGLKYGDVCALLRLEITLEDGTVKTITTNTEDWKYKYSPITTNNLYAGETYDARLEIADFASYNGSDKGWGTVVEDSTPKGILKPCLMPLIRQIRELPAKSVHCASGTDDGVWIFDIGENISGFAEFKLPVAPKGQVFVFRYSETLTRDGQLDVRSTGAFATQCIQQDIYVAKGDPKGETYRPRSVYHGFRYVEVSGIYDTSEGYGTMPKTSLVTGIQIATDLKNTFRIETSNKDLNSLLAIMKNTFISNYHGYPEDCPAREKCGWLGDAQVVCNYGLLNFDGIPAYRKYMSDIRTSKEVFGTWKMIAPGKRTCGNASPLWGCAQIIIPYYMYKYCGDASAVTDNFDLMEEWVQHELDRSEEFIISEGLGDWCPPKGNGSPRRMPVEHSSTLMFFEICTIMAELCTDFGIGNASYYKDLSESIKTSFINKFYNREEHSYGYWGTDGVALETKLYPSGERESIVENLIRTIRNDDYEMPTAIYANKYLVPLLMKEGYGDDAFKFIFNRDHSSFATMMDDGATTVWEQVDMKNVADTNSGVASYNHPMHGGFLYFAVTDLCGINPEENGFSKIRFAPKFISAVEEFSATAELVSGKVEAEVKSIGSKRICRLCIPAGVKAVIDVKGDVCVDGEPYRNGTEIGSGEHTISVMQ